MKKTLTSTIALIMSIFVLSATTAKADTAYSGVQWGDFENNTFIRSSKSYSPILLFVTTGWCRFCKEMTEKTFQDRPLSKYIMTNFIPVTASADDINVVKKYNITALPTIIVMDGTGKVIEQFSGYRDIKQTMKVLVNAFRKYQMS